MKTRYISLIKPMINDFIYHNGNPFDIYHVVHKTGHCHYMSPYEQDDTCGNCDGANCDRCKEYNEVRFDTGDSLYTTDNWIKSQIINQLQTSNFPECKNYNHAKEILSHIHWEYIPDNSAFWEDTENTVRYEIEWYTEENLKENYKDFYELMIAPVYVVWGSGHSPIAVFKDKEKAKGFYKSLTGLYKDAITDSSFDITDKYTKSNNYFSYTHEKEGNTACYASVSLSKEAYGNVGNYPIIK